MGCCFSRPSGPNSPYPGVAQSGSARALNSPANPLQSQPDPIGEDQSSPNQRQQNHGTRRSRRPLDQHINKPLRRQEWASKDRSWSRNSLDRERTEFFDTRVSGHSEIWQTLKAALEVLWEADIAHQPTPTSLDGTETEADSDEHNPAVALATAQSILDAADITLPTGNLADGVYDALGNYYQLPAQVVSDPVNIVSGDGVGDDNTKDDLPVAEDTSGNVDPGLHDTQRRREDKGKGVIDARTQVLAVVRLSETSRDLKLHVGKDENVRCIIRRILEETGHRPDYRIRIVFLGKILKENTSLENQGWQPGQVLNAFMYDPPR